MSRILLLGHRGMLGRAVHKYFKEHTVHEVTTIDIRWGDLAFETDLHRSNADYIVNCIGKIPQKNLEEAEYITVNIGLPRFLETLDIPTIHPSTDCEFKGDLPEGEAYTKESPRDADDPYGVSKAAISKEIEENYHNTKIIRTSIIGHEESTSVSLLDWFLTQSESVRGYTNHFWNGITTLEWAKQSQKLIENWNSYPTLNQLSTATHYSKYDVLSTVKEIYEKNIDIVPFATELTINKCLKSDWTIPELKEQLHELRIFFKK